MRLTFLAYWLREMLAAMGATMIAVYTIAQTDNLAAGVAVVVFAGVVSGVAG